MASIVLRGTKTDRCVDEICMHIIFPTNRVKCTINGFPENVDRHSVKTWHTKTIVSQV